jgi:hypothetical protein
MARKMPRLRQTRRAKRVRARRDQIKSCRTGPALAARPYRDFQEISAKASAEPGSSATTSLASWTAPLPFGDALLERISEAR